MSGKELLEGMSHVEERFVEEAETDAGRFGHNGVWKWGSLLAACLTLFLLIWNPIPSAPTEGLLNDQESPGGGETNEIIPECIAGGECSSVVLRVDEMTEDGFIGTVTEQTETDLFETGMELRVVFADAAGVQLTDGSSDFTPEGESGQQELEGASVIVRFLSYDKETGTMIADMIELQKSP